MTTINYYLKYKRELMVMILENENDDELYPVLQKMNLHATKIYGLDEMKNNTLTNYFLHYQGGRLIAINKDSVLGKILVKKV